MNLFTEKYELLLYHANQVDSSSFTSIQKKNLTNKSSSSTINKKKQDPSHHSLIKLQQRLGNQGMQRLLKSGVLQAKLKIGKSNDPYEQEADRVTNQIMRMPTSDISANKKSRKKCSSCDMEEDELKISRKPSASNNLQASDKISNQISNTSGGKPLDSSTKSFMESRFSHDFSNVRIHDDSKSNELSGSVSARAFTTGNDIFIGKNESASDRKLMAHELTHVVQGQKYIQRQKDEPEPKPGIDICKRDKIKIDVA